MSACPRCHTPLPVDGLYCSQCPPDYSYELGQRLAQALEGRYEIIRLLGRGGMAAVFLAQDLVLERQVAITLRGADKALLGQTAAKLRALREPDPYKGKGIKYSDEVIRRKVGKKAGAGAKGSRRNGGHRETSGTSGCAGSYGALRRGRGWP